MNRLSKSDIRVTELVAAGFREEGEKYSHLQARRYNIGAHPPKDGILAIIVSEASKGGRVLAGANIGHPAPLSPLAEQKYRQTGRDLAGRVAKLTAAIRCSCERRHGGGTLMHAGQCKETSADLRIPPPDWISAEGPDGSVLVFCPSCVAS